MMNAFRFLRYTIRCLTPVRRYRHQRRDYTAMMAGFGGALILSAPVWMILLGII